MSVLITKSCRLKSLVAALAGMTLIVLPACGVSGKSGATSRPAAKQAARTTVMLTDAGTGTKTKLRLHFRKGARTNMAVKVTSRITQDISGRQETVKIPPIIEDISLRVVDVKDGVASFHFVITGAKLDNDGSLSRAQAQSVQSTLRRIIGLSSDGKIDDRGAQLSSDMHIPSSVPSEMRQVLQQLSDQFSALSVPLPDEAVGLGATWTATSNPQLSGARIALRSEYRLTDVRGALFTLEVTQHQTAKPQSFQFPTVPAGAHARIIAWDITSSGTQSLRLGNIFPVATLHSSGRQSFSITPANADRQVVAQDLSVDTVITDLGN